MLVIGCGKYTACQLETSVDIPYRLSCTAFFSQFYRCYSPIAFPKKWDPEGSFVRKYVPELAHYDKKYIYEPHLAPIADQKKWGCIVKGDGTESNSDGKDVYPKPMFDFNERRQFCIDKISKAYQTKMYGDSSTVLNRQWKTTFDFADRGTSLKDEADVDADSVVKGTKRGRGRGGNLVKEDRDNTFDDEPPRKATKTPSVGKKGQRTLDNMVSRKKGRS